MGSHRMPAVAPGAGKTQGERGHVTWQAEAGRLLCASLVGTRGKDREQGGGKGGEGSASRRDHHFTMPMAETFTRWPRSHSEAGNMG